MVAKPVVLIVEDDFLFRMLAVDMTEHAGFSVLQAADPDEAIEVLQKRADIRLVFTDIDMPGSMDGLELAHAIRPLASHSSRPDLGQNVTTYLNAAALFPNPMILVC